VKKLIKRKGSVELIGETIVVHNASTAYIFLSAGTTFRYDDPEAASLDRLDAAVKFGYDQLREQHIEDYRHLYSRLSFRLGNHTAQKAEALRPTSERMAMARHGKADLSLIPLYYQFGRYLLISSSRSGHKALPSNLQGIWNEKMAPTWGSKFTINVNAEMNYWPAETASLSECHEPFLSFLERMQVNGEVTARKMYNCAGWVAHHNTDIWADSAPQDRVITATLWPMGGAWVCTHIWHHFEFTGDTGFLSRAYAVLRGCVEFFLDFLIERDGYKVTSPSLSPENRYRLPNGEEGTLCVAPTMDSQLLFRLFTDFLAAAEILRKDEDREMRLKVENYRAKLPPLRIGSFGQLQEWWQDHEEVEPGHRHISHLWGLYPGNQITSKDVDLIKACKVTLARRAASGGGHTGWSRAWMIALWARLCDGDEAGKHIGEILRTSTHDSLLDDHPPFQIDGNFGTVAGITEMLVQSHAGEIFIHPALPSSWLEGSIKGVRARGGFELDIEWSCGWLTACTIKSNLGNNCVLNSKQKFTVMNHGEKVIESSSAGHPVSFDTTKSKTYSVTF
jgi:alpha-L-fucosidase 2